MSLSPTSCPVQPPWSKTPLTFDRFHPRGSHSRDAAPVPSVSPASLALHAPKKPPQKATCGSPCFFPLDPSLRARRRQPHPCARGPGQSVVVEGRASSPAPRPCREASARGWRKQLRPAASRQTFPVQEELLSQPRAGWKSDSAPGWQSRSSHPFPGAAPSCRHWSSVPVPPCAARAGLLPKPWQLPVTRSGSGGFVWVAAVGPSPAGAALPVSCRRGASELLEVS